MGSALAEHINQIQTDGLALFVLLADIDQLGTALSMLFRLFNFKVLSRQISLTDLSAFRPLRIVQ